MKATKRALAGCLLAVALTTAASASHAQDRPAQLEGTFALVEAPSRARQKIDTAIGRVVDEMSFLIRGFARDRLRGKNPAHRTVGVRVRGERIAVTYDGDRFETVSGRWQDVTAGGERVQLLQQVVGERLFQTFRSGDGEKNVVMRFSEDRRALTLDVTVTSPRLPEPLRYRLSYRARTSEPAR